MTSPFPEMDFIPTPVSELGMLLECAMQELADAGLSAEFGALLGRAALSFQILAYQTTFLGRDPREFIEANEILQDFLDDHPCIPDVMHDALEHGTLLGAAEMEDVAKVAREAYGLQPPDLDTD